MREISSTRSRVTVLGSVVVAAAALGVLGYGVGTPMSAAQAPQSNFMGGNPTQMDAKAIRTLRLRFPGRQPLELAQPLARSVADG